MIHLGDITQISGYTAPIVDVVVGGSPCQDLSVAGKRAGLDGERSGLFMEQLRIIKEMRESDRRNGADVDIRPRYMVWENVPGAFSSNKAEDFRIVLEETAKVCDKDAVIPMPNNGKWTTSGCILGDGWSIAWRVCDAQFYGVPQRRRRIALIADFGGHSAPEILFVRKSMSRDSEQSQPQRKATTSDVARGIGADDSKPSIAYTMQDREGKAGGGKGALIAEELSATLRAGFAQTLFQPVVSVDQCGGKSACNVQEGQAPTLTCTHGGEPAVCYSVENHPADSRVEIDESGKVQTLTSRMGTGGGNVPMVMTESQVYEWHNQDSRITGPIDVGCTISTNAGGREGHLVITPVSNQCYSKSKRAQSDTDYETWKESDVANTLNAFDIGDKRTTECVVALDRASFNQGKNAMYDFEVSDKGVNSPLVAKGPSAVAYTIDEKCANTYVWKEQANTLAARDYKQPQTVVAAVDCRNCTENSDTNGTLQSHMSGGSSLNLNNVVRVKYIVRRLTPLECERLQGYPDGWTDIGEWTDSKGKVHKTSDAARYKALGNSIALPPWKWIMKRLSACYERDATLASLFDGIGGFPLIWEQINGKGSCLWASEIEDFPIAVTKKRIGG